MAEVPIKKATAVPVKKMKSQSGSVCGPVEARVEADLHQQKQSACPAPAKPRVDANLAQQGSACPTPATETADPDTTAAGLQPPPRRQLPPPPSGNITQEQGRAYCDQICKLYPEVFDGQKGQFRGAQAQLFVKDRHWEKLKKVGVRPPAKVPYGLQEQYDEKLDKMLQDMTQVNGQDIFVASQIVPVCETKNGEKILKRLAVNYKSTINEQWKIYPSCQRYAMTRWTS